MILFTQLSKGPFALLSRQKCGIVHIAPSLSPKVAMRNAFLHKLLFVLLVTLSFSVFTQTAKVKRKRSRDSLGSIKGKQARAPSSLNVPLTKSSFNKFHSWFEKIGGTRRGIRLGPVNRVESSKARDGGAAKTVGVYATSTVKLDDNILSMPMNYVICEDRIRVILKNMRSNSALKKALRNLRHDEDIVTLFMMHEAAKGKASDWAPYLHMLPSHRHSPLFFSDNDIKGLQDKFVILEVQNHREVYNRKYQAIKPALQKLFSGLSPGKRRIHASKENWLYWSTTVDARALIIRGKRYIVPFADMFRYKPHNSERGHAHGNFFLHYHRIEGNYFNIYADRRTEIGREIFEDYGDNSNLVYLLHHGFVPDHNPFDCTYLPLPKLRLDDPHLALKRQLLDMTQGLSTGNANEKYVCVGMKGLNRDSMFYFRVLMMSDGDALRCEKRLEEVKYQSRMGYNINSVMRCLTSENDADIYQHVHLILKDKLLNFKTTFEDDKIMLDALYQKKVNTSNPKISPKAPLKKIKINEMALRFRLQNKKVLRSLIQYFAKTSTDGESEVEQHTRLKGVVRIFNRWIRKHSPTVLKIKAATAKGMRLGVVATEDISAGKPYATIPSQIVLNVENARRTGSPLVRVFEELKLIYPHANDEFHELLFHLIYERFAKNVESYWWPYLATLPNMHELHFPIFYRQKSLQALQGSSIIQLIREYTKKIKDSFLNVKERVFQLFPGVFDNEHFSYENYKWAYAVLDSRSIWWNDQRHLVPLLDLINCASGPEGSNVHYTDIDAEGKNVVTLAPWSFNEGDQVFEDYGSPNWVYFLYHGFVNLDNRYDCVRVELRLSESDISYHRKFEQLRARGLDSANEFCLNPTNLKGDLWQVIKIIYSLNEKDFTTPPKILQKLLADMLEQYPTTMAEDEAILADENVTDMRLKVATRFRWTEKYMMEAIIKEIDKMLKSMGVAKAEL